MSQNIAVFASGSGSNYEALIQAAEQGRLQADVALLVCDKPGAKVLTKAQTHGTETFVFSAKDYDGKAAYEQAVLDALKAHHIDFVVLAGYMRLLGETLLTAYRHHIVNIHPSLLPAFPGKDAIGQAFAAGVKISGVTIHYVDEGMDTGTIIAQEAVTVLDGDTYDDLAGRIQQVEHRLYPLTVQQLLNDM